METKKLSDLNMVDRPLRRFPRLGLRQGEMAQVGLG